jgi:hypothetical protein
MCMSIAKAMWWTAAVLTLLLAGRPEPVLCCTAGGCALLWQTDTAGDAITSLSPLLVHRCAGTATGLRFLNPYSKVVASSWVGLLLSGPAARHATSSRGHTPNDQRREFNNHPTSCGEVLITARFIVLLSLTCTSVARLARCPSKAAARENNRCNNI